MTLSEFKAWLEGYSASFVDAPSAKQWLVITEKLATIGIPALSLPSVFVPTAMPSAGTPNDLQRRFQSGGSTADYIPPSLVVSDIVDQSMSRDNRTTCGALATMQATDW